MLKGTANRAVLIKGKAVQLIMYSERFQSSFDLRYALFRIQCGIREAYKMKY